MKRHMHWWVGAIFLFTLLYDFAVWGALARWPEFGARVQASAYREALLATVYMGAGSAMDRAIPPLDSWSSHYLEAALSEGFPRFKDDPKVAVDVIFTQTWNVRHATLKVMYWAAPVLGVVTLVLWSMRPKKVRMMGRRG